MPAPVGSSRRSATGSQDRDMHTRIRIRRRPHMARSRCTRALYIALRQSRRGTKTAVWHPPRKEASLGKVGAEVARAQLALKAVAGAGGARAEEAGVHPPSIVYAPARHSRGTHFSPPRIVHMPSAHGSSANGVLLQGPAQGQISPTHGSVQAQRDPGVQQQAAVRQSIGTPASLSEESPYRFASYAGSIDIGLRASTISTVDA